MHRERRKKKRQCDSETKTTNPLPLLFPFPSYDSLYRENSHKTDQTSPNPEHSGPESVLRRSSGLSLGKPISPPDRGFCALPALTPTQAIARSDIRSAEDHGAQLGVVPTPSPGRKRKVGQVGEVAASFGSPSEELIVRHRTCRDVGSEGEKQLEGEGGDISNGVES